MQTKKPLEDDKELLARAQAGDRRAFDLLMPQYIGAIRRQLSLMLKRHQDVDDVLQIVLYRVWRFLPKFRGDCALSTWLYRIAHNCAVKHYHARGPTMLSLDTAGEDSEGMEVPYFTTPDQILEARQESARVAFSWMILPRELGQALFLYEIELRSYEEIATIQSAPVGTVRSRIHRARAQVCGCHIDE
jgi:RNA polymerase sigma-70 factor (ECF subfamily)